MGYKAGVDKKQLALLPASVDEYVPEDHICRVIHAFIGQLDMSALGFKHAEATSTGSPPYDPRMLLGLYLYGYLHRVRSSRRLEAETMRNVEVMWLLDGLRPDDKTISNFRKDNTHALREAFRAFVQMCRRLGLYGEELVATDSVKFRAQNSLKRNYNETVVKNELSRIEKKIAEYMNALEQGDREEAGEERPSAAAIRCALEALKERKVKFEALHKRVEAEGEISAVDSEARLMRSGGDGRKLDVGYNVHTVVDSKYHMIVGFELTNNAHDSGNLYRMSEQAKEAMEASELTNLADKGYYNSEDIARCEGSGVSCLVAKPRAGGAPRKAEGFNREDFVYDGENDRYICPCKNPLEYRRTVKKNGGREYRVYANYPACNSCPMKSECTKYKYREIIRLPCQDVVDIVDKRTRDNKELYHRRQEIVEHVFGTVKAVWGYKQFLCRGKQKVTGETSLAYMAYNMRRVVNIFKESKLMPVFG